MPKSMKAPAPGEVILPGGPEEPVVSVEEETEDPISVSHSQLLEIYPAIGDGEEDVDDEITAVEEIAEVDAPELGEEPSPDEDPRVDVRDGLVIVRWFTRESLARDWPTLSHGSVPVSVFTPEAQVTVRLVVPGGHAYEVPGRVSPGGEVKVRLGVQLRQRLRSLIDG